MAAAQQPSNIWSLTSLPLSEYSKSIVQLPAEDLYKLMKMLENAIHTERIRVDSLQDRIVSLETPDLERQVASAELQHRQRRLADLIDKHKLIRNKHSESPTKSGGPFVSVVQSQISTAVNSKSNRHSKQKSTENTNIKSASTVTTRNRHDLTVAPTPSSRVSFNVARNRSPLPINPEILETVLKYNEPTAASDLVPQRQFGASSSDSDTQSTFHKPSSYSTNSSPTPYLKHHNHDRNSPKTSTPTSHSQSQSIKFRPHNSSPHSSSINNRAVHSIRLLSEKTPQSHPRSFKTKSLVSLASGADSSHNRSSSIERSVYIPLAERDQNSFRRHSVHIRASSLSPHTRALDRTALYDAHDRLIDSLRHSYKGDYRRPTVINHFRVGTPPDRELVMTDAVVTRHTTTSTKTMVHSEFVSSELGELELSNGDAQRQAEPNNVASKMPITLHSRAINGAGSPFKNSQSNGQPTRVHSHINGRELATPELTIFALPEQGPVSPSRMTEPAPQAKIDPEVGSAWAQSPESNDCKEWDPTPLVQYLHRLDYVPRNETKQRRFTNMEGIMQHLPLGVKTAVTEKMWKDHYFKTREGRLYWFQTAYADDPYALGELMLAGAEVTFNRDECTFMIHGGRDHSLIVLRCHSNLLEKWRLALQSHAALSVTDSYILPIYPPVPSDNRIVIIELGSSAIRAGVLTNDPSLPQVFFPTMATILPDGKPIIGCTALKPEYRHSGTVVRPLMPTQPGVDKYTINDELMKYVMHKIFTELNVNPREYRVMLTVPQNVPVSALHPMMTYLLADLHIRSLAITRQSCLVLYAYDVTTGVAVDLGQRCNIVPVVDGYVVENAHVSVPLGALPIQDKLRANLNEQNLANYAFQSPVEQFILRHIMEAACYVAGDCDKELAACNKSQKEYTKLVTLDNFEPTPQMKTKFELGSARFTSTEGLVQPKKWGMEIEGLSKLIFGAIQTAPMDSRRPLYKNIYLSGGVSLLPGIAERLETELSKLVSSSISVQVHMSPWRYHAAYLGAQVVASSKQWTQTTTALDQLDSYMAHLQANDF